MADTKGFKAVMDILEKAVTAMCIIYGLILLFVYFSSPNRMMPCFIDPLVIGLVFLLLGIYPFARKRGLERLKRKGKYI